MSRSHALTLLAVLLLLALALPLFAQETADIALGGGLVARLRDRGAYATVRERAAHVDQCLAEVVSSKDTQHPQVTVKRQGNLWTVYAWDLAVLSVYPAEAKVNNLPEKQLAAMWAANLKAQLPKATPCSKLPPEQLGYKPAGKPVAAGKPAAAAKPVTVSTGPVAVKPAAAAPPAGTGAVAKPGAVAPVKPTSTMVGGETGAMLLIVDALRTARELNDADWAAQKESLARGLYGDLGYYLTGKGVAPKLPAAATKPVTTTVKPVTAVTKPVTTKPVTATTKPVTTATKPATATKPVTATKPATAATKPATAVKPVDASMLKVPQKNRIREKFAAAKVPFDKLKAADPQAAEAVSNLLSESRKAFAYGNFDESEKQVDAALAALGVEFKPKQ